MNIVGKRVKHRKYGEGVCVFVDAERVIVEFPNVGEKKFNYPISFESFLKFTDEQANSEICEEINSYKQRLAQEAEAQIQQKTEERLRAEAERQTERERQRTRTSHRNRQRPEKPNIAFKCNYCDGGSSANCIGFKGRCSVAMQKYNIEDREHIWCKDPQCICMQEHEGIAPSATQTTICYESRMLIDWEARAGVVRNGKREGEPMRLTNVTTNSLAVLTTRLPQQEEPQRIIFAVFLVRHAEEGDEVEEGKVEADSLYRIELTPNQANQMKFWNYYQNDSDSEKAFWGSGLHRYFDDLTAEHILRDIVALKRKTAQEAPSDETIAEAETAERFYSDFCEMNGIGQRNNNQ